MTDKYTEDSPEIANHEEYYIQYVSNDVAKLMNHAYKEGFKEGIARSIEWEQKLQEHFENDR